MHFRLPPRSQSLLIVYLRTPSTYKMATFAMQGRGEGRKLRRRRWQQRVLERKAQRREHNDQLRAEARAHAAAQVHAAEEQRRSKPEEGDSAAERLRRLQELRARLGKRCDKGTRVPHLDRRADGVVCL